MNAHSPSREWVFDHNSSAAGRTFSCLATWRDLQYVYNLQQKLAQDHKILFLPHPPQPLNMFVHSCGFFFLRSGTVELLPPMLRGFGGSIDGSVTITHSYGQTGRGPGIAPGAASTQCRTHSATYVSRMEEINVRNCRKRTGELSMHK